MSDRNDCFSWSGVACGVLGVAMLALGQHEGRKAKQLQQAHPLTSVSAAKELGKCLPVLVAARGVANSDDPMTGRISTSKAVIIEEKEELSALKQNEKGAWCPEFKLVKHHQRTPNWFISDDEGRSRLWVENAFEAAQIENALKSEKQFQEGQSSAYHRLISRLSGYQPLGVWETERSLPVGTRVTVVGELAKAQNVKDGMVIRRPTDAFSGRPFYITPRSFDELQESLMRNTGLCKMLGIGFGTVSVLLLGIQLWRHVRSTLHFRRIQKQVAEAERHRGEQETSLSSAKSHHHTCRDPEDRGKCIVCWDRPADAIFIPCGHFCACLRCCIELNRCPVCRSRCTVHRIYFA